MRRTAAFIAAASAIALGSWLAWPDKESGVLATPSEHSTPSQSRSALPGTLPQRAPLSGETAPAPSAPARGLVAGRVLDALGQPLPDCSVALQPPSAQQPFAPGEPESPLVATRSGHDGRYMLELDRPAVGHVTVRHPDFPPRVVAFDVEVAPGTVRDLGDVTLSSQPGLVLVVRGASGSLIADAAVTATPALQDLGLPAAIGSLAVRSARSDASGQAVLYGLGPGPYVLRTEAPNWATDERNHLQPDNPPQAPKIEIALAPGHVITGRAHAPAGVDPGRVSITAEPLAGGPLLRGLVRADGDGEFRLTGAAAGRYRIWADPANLPRAMVEVDVPASGIVLLPLGAGLAISGVVRRAEDGRVLAGAHVTAEPEDGWPLTRGGETVRPHAITGPDGDFSIPGLPSGRFVLTVSSEGLVPTRLGPVVAGSEPVEVRLDAGLTVHGTLRLDGRPLAQARVRAIAWDGEAPAFALWRASLTQRAAGLVADPSPSGRFELNGVPVRGHRIVVEGEELAPWFSEPLRGRPGESLDLGTIELAPGCAVEGTAVPHATVCLASTGERGLSRTTRADGMGRFAFRSLPAGAYTLFYHSAGRAPAGAAAPPTPNVELPVTLGRGDRRFVSLKN